MSKHRLAPVEGALPADHVGRLLTRQEVLDIVNVTYPTLWTWVREGHLPAPRQVGFKGNKCRIGWVEGEVREWILALPKRFPKGTDLTKVA
jgi:predicted DNA-binding transcriptional regulator AlpA